MRLLLTVLSLLMLASPLFAQTDTVWTKIYKPDADDYIDRLYGGCVTSDGNMVFNGYSDSHQWWNGKQYVMKIDTAGDTLWSAGFGTSQRNYGSDVVETYDKGLAVVGYGRLASISEDYKIRLFRTDSLGNQLWEKSFVGTDDCYAFGMIETSDSGLAVAGYDGLFTSQNMCLMRTNALGDSLWFKSYGGAGIDQARDVAQTADGGFMIVGSTTSYGAGREDVYIVRTDAAGDTVWTRTFGDTSIDVAYAIVKTDAGDYVVAGASLFAGPSLTQRMYLIRIEDDGDTLWTRSIYGGTSSQAYGVCQAKDGGFLVTGKAQYGGNTDVGIVKVSASGDSVWAVAFGGASTDEGWFVHQYPNGDIYAAGTHSYSSGPDYYVLKLAEAAVGVGDDGGSTLPESHALSQNYPNPFNPATVIEFSLSQPSDVSITIFNSLGQKVSELVDEPCAAGTHRVRWDGLSSGGQRVSSGVYFYRLVTADAITTKKMILLR